MKRAWQRLSQENMHNHLGIKQYLNQSTLLRANENRDSTIFADLGNYMIQEIRSLYADFLIPDVHIKHEVFALDSTTVSHSLKLFSWAPVKYSRGAI